MQPSLTVHICQFALNTHLIAKETSALSKALQLAAAGNALKVQWLLYMGFGDRSQWMQTCLSNALQEGCSVWQQVQGCFHRRPHKVCVHRRQRRIVCLTGCLRNETPDARTLTPADKIYITFVLHQVPLSGAEALLQA